MKLSLINKPFNHKTILQRHRWNAKTHYARPGSCMKRMHMKLSAADMEPDAALFLPIGNYSSLRVMGN